MTVSIAQIPPQDRPRERLDRLGPHALTDAELVALVLRSGAPGRNALEVAHELLAEHGGLGSLARHALHDIAAVHSVGAAKASSLVAAFELGRRAEAGEAPPAVRIRDAGDVVAAVRRSIVEPAREESFVVILNAARYLVRIELLTKGTEVRCLLDIRDVISMVLRFGGAAFALAHTHPSGDPRPSPEDVAVSRALGDAARVVGLAMVDHVILAGSKWARVDGVFEEGVLGM